VEITGVEAFIVFLILVLCERCLQSPLVGRNKTYHVQAHYQSNTCVPIFRCICMQYLMTALTKEKGGSRSCKRCSAVRRDREPKRHARTQQAWTNMVRRCLRPNAKEAPTYAGMYIDPNWVTDYFAFLADMGECPLCLDHDKLA
jgi:hypothetical protein